MVTVEDAPLDCIVVGGGPAGLTAAIYLARYRRRFCLIDASASRARLIPLSHNLPGFTQGVRGTELLEMMTSQAKKFGAEIVPGVLDSLERGGDGVFTATLRSGPREYRARTVLLATGVVDREPELPNVESAVRRGLIRHCPICDGYEVIDKKIGVIGSGNSALQEALFLLTYTRDITLLSLGKPLDLSRQELRRAADAGIKIVEYPIAQVVIKEDRIKALTTESGEAHIFDSLYSALGSVAQSDLARGLGANVDDKGCIETDRHQRTSLEGLFAAGDVVRGLNQIGVAIGEGAIAATSIHNLLRGSPG
jgi:thioredoxin reductase (NADPH)